MLLKNPRCLTSVTWGSDSVPTQREHEWHGLRLEGMNSNQMQSFHDSSSCARWVISQWVITWFCAILLNKTTEQTLVLLQFLSQASSPVTLNRIRVGIGPLLLFEGVTSVLVLIIGTRHCFSTWRSVNFSWGAEYSLCKHCMSPESEASWKIGLMTSAGSPQFWFVNPQKTVTQTVLQAGGVGFERCGYLLYQTRRA